MDHAVKIPIKKPRKTGISLKKIATALGLAEPSTQHPGPHREDLFDDVSEMRSRKILIAMMEFSAGDFSSRLPADWAGTDGRIAEAFNQAIANASHVTVEADRLRTTVGKEGRLYQRMSSPGALSGWAAQVDSLNILIDDLVRPTTDIARTIGAVAKGDLGQSMDLQVDGRELKGEFLRSAKLVNSMIEQLFVFTSEVTRVAREVGTDGRLGGQAVVSDVAGTWKDMTDNVCVRVVLTGGDGHIPLARRLGHRPVADQEAGGDARRQRVGAQRRFGPWQRVRNSSAPAGNSPAGCGFRAGFARSGRWGGPAGGTLAHPRGR